MPTFRSNVSSLLSGSKVSLLSTSSGFFFVLFFNHEDGDDMLLRIFGLSPNYTASQPRRPYCTYSPRWEPQTQKSRASGFSVPHQRNLKIEPQNHLVSFFLPRELPMRNLPLRNKWLVRWQVRSPWPDIMTARLPTQDVSEFWGYVWNRNISMNAQDFSCETGWSGGKAVVLYVGGIRFESRLGHGLSWLRVFFVFPEPLQAIPFPSTSFSIHQLSDSMLTRYRKCT
jgi:hypothetical protein